MFRKIASFYYDGFRNLPSWGRQIWLVILVKLFIMFVILKLFFFNDFLGSRFGSEEEKSEYVRNQFLGR